MFMSPQVGEIHFKNSYVAYMTVKAKCRITDSKDGKFSEVFNPTALRTAKTP